MKNSLFFVSLFLISANAEASVYCNANGATVIDGGVSDKYVKYVVSTVKRPEIPGRPAERPWCFFDFNSLGGVYRSPVLVKKPAFVQFKFRNNRTSIKADRIGRDEATVEYYWTNHVTNKQQSGRINWHIEVVDRPM
jgi:hypothetical protein